MLLSNPAASLIFVFMEEVIVGEFESGNDRLCSLERPLPKAGCDTFLGVSFVQLNPEAMNLCLTRNRQTSPAVEKCLRHNTLMTKVFRLLSQ